MSAPQKEPKKSRTYFIIGFVLLLFMGITWSLDASFVYLSLGAATFFFFLAYYHRPVPIVRNSNRAREESFSSQRSSQESRTRFRTTAPNNTSQRVMLAVMLAVGGIFLVVFIGILSADDTAMEEEINTNPLYQKAEQARYEARYDSAEYYYRQILKSDPSNLDALNGIGIVSLNMQRYEMALRQFEQALRIDPEYKFARYNKALTYYYQNNYRKSLSESFALMNINPDYYEVMSLVGDNYYAQQRIDSAKYWYSQAYENGVRDAWLCQILGYLYDKESNTEQAIELYKEALSYDSSKYEIYERLSELYPGEEGDFYRDRLRVLNSK